MPPPPDTASWDDFISIARTYQYDRYLAATLAPRAVRGELIVLTAFAAEMSRIPLAVSEPTIAAIRLQWWRDALSHTDGERTGNPLADALRDVIVRHELPTGLVIGLIDTQELELYADLVEDLHALKIHFAKRDGALFTLAARILAGATTGIDGDALSVGAQAYGLAGSLAELNFRLNGRQLLLPGDRAAAHGIRPGMVLASGQQAAAEALIGELAEVVRRDLAIFRDAQAGFAAAVRPAFLPIALTESYLSFAERQFDAAKSGETGPSRLTKSWRLLMAHWWGKV